jgi:hypothetical protein
MWQDDSMSQTFGMEAPRKHTGTPRPAPARYLVVIESGGSMVARLFQETREQVSECDAAVEDITVMTQHLAPQQGALGPEWDLGLQGHSRAERAGARVYTLNV